MRKASIILIALAAAAAGAEAAATKLLVVVSVDQMRAEFLERGNPGGGLERLRKQGAVYSNARHGHVPTETCPGHSVILTGRYPAETGIVANDWYDANTGKTVYCVDDPLFERSPRLLRSYALGDGLKAAKPGARVFSVSVKDRAAIMLGGQRPDHVIWFDKKNGRFTTSRYYEPVAWLDGLNEDLRKKGAPLHGHSGDATKLAEDIPGDDLVMLAAFAALKREKLGRDEIPDLLAVSFSATDYVGHYYGPDSPRMDEQLGRLDKNLARLMDELDDRVGKGTWSLVLTADHGSTPMPSSERGKALKLRDLTYGQLERRLEKAMQYSYPSPGPWIVAFYPPHVYLSTSAAARVGLPAPELLRQAARILSVVEDVAGAYVPGEVPPSEPAAAALARGWDAERGGDVLVVQKSDVALAEEGRGNHGSPNDWDARVPLVFLGSGFASGRFETPAFIVDLAPTAAAMLGVKFPVGTEARVLPEAFAK